MHHPYKTAPGAERLIPSAVLSADILGFKALSDATADPTTGTHLLRRVTHALRNAYQALRERADMRWSPDDEPAGESFAIKTFTDNLVLGYPMDPHSRSDGESELGRVLDVLTELQCSLAKDGFIIRGGMAMGELYVDDDMAIGPALVEAAKQDRSGGAPRVRLAWSAEKAVRKHLGFYAGNGRHAPQNDYLLVDADDGAFFVNYLYAAWAYFPEGPVRMDILEGHKRTVERGLAHGEPSVRAKYEWTARYHNHVLDGFIGRWGEEPEVGPDSDPERASEWYAAWRSANVMKGLRVDVPDGGSPLMKPWQYLLEGR